MKGDDRIIEIDVLAAQQRNRRNRMMITGLCMIGAAVAAAFFLLPSANVIESAHDREVASASSITTIPLNQRSGRAQELAGPKGTLLTTDSAAVLYGDDVALIDIVNARDPRAFPHPIVLRNVEVQTVPGDKVFSVGVTPANSVLVKIEEPTEPGHLTENALVVRPGSRVAISGTVEPIASFSELTKTFGVNGYEAGRIGNTSLVIKADTVQLLD